MSRQGVSKKHLQPFRWYESLDTAEEAIGPLLGALSLAIFDAGYDEAFLHELIKRAWPGAMTMAKRDDDRFDA